ncbi:MAG: protein phosphatase 2C domain-containing protein [Cytophagales bacterium]|nr:protein phosphatase 2C domain-containing protein [Bernardetiaceae bacterium]MDW8209799.1 protein phosphatase 2C domain-containing protein [Cytophagales bacterium]
MILQIAQPIGFSRQGRRSNNEDCIFPLEGTATPADRLFIVCDGVGGAAKGEVASQLACQIISDFFRQNYYKDYEDYKEFIFQAVKKVQQAFDEHVANNADASGMATTLALLHLHDDLGAVVAHIGDSRIYQIRNGQVIFCTSDHSLVNEWVMQGILTAQEAAFHPQKNIITRALHESIYGKSIPDIELIDDIQPNDYFFLCTDGMLEAFTDDQLADLLNGNLSEEQKMAALERMGENASYDNFSAYLVKIQAVE